MFVLLRIARKGASPAVVTERFYRASSGPAGSVPAGTVVKSASGIAYVTALRRRHSSRGALSSHAVSCRAQQAGKLQQVGANTLVAFGNAQALFDPTLHCVNDAPAAGGEDVEDDDTFRERVRGFWQAARRGVAGAIEFGALLVPGVVSAQAVEALSFSGSPARIVNLYIADSSGIANAALARAVQIGLLDYRAAGIQVLVSASLPTIVPVVLDLTFASNVDTNSLAELVRSAIVEYVNSLPVNGTLTVGAMQSVLQRFASSGLITSGEHRYVEARRRRRKCRAGSFGRRSASVALASSTPRRRLSSKSGR